jgi:hypothetical protein
MSPEGFNMEFPECSCGRTMYWALGTWWCTNCDGMKGEDT